MEAVSNVALFILIPLATEQIIEHMHIIFIQEMWALGFVNVFSGFL